MKLDTFLQSKVRWHLGYNITSIPAGDQARLEEALNGLDAIENNLNYIASDEVLDKWICCHGKEKNIRIFICNVLLYCI